MGENSGLNTIAIKSSMIHFSAAKQNALFQNRNMNLYERKLYGFQWCQKFPPCHPQKFIMGHLDGLCTTKDVNMRNHMKMSAQYSSGSYFVVLLK